MCAVLELEHVKRAVESISLVHPTISFSVRNDATGECVLQRQISNWYERCLFCLKVDLNSLVLFLVMDTTASHFSSFMLMADL